MASSAGTDDFGGESYVSEMMAKHGVKTIPEDERHSSDVVFAAFVLIDIFRFPKDLAQTSSDKRKLTNSGSSGEPSSKKLKNVEEMNIKGKEKVQEDSPSEEDNYDDESWRDSGIYESDHEEIDSLPPPPLALMQQPMLCERFTDLRINKSSICTIMPRDQEVTVYFRKEEELRYKNPHHAFSYITCDGGKASVAPIRKCCGKPSKKMREHYILKPDRPPAFTVLCLVRDAAARLPDFVGTKSDVCSLVRDSQFLTEDVSEEQLKQVVSGALDRLRYELDPCVMFDKETRLWYYLHGNRSEDDFAENCTTSTKKRKRKVKETRSVGKEVEVKSDTMQGRNSGSAGKEVEEKSDTMQESNCGSAEKEVEGKSETMQESNSGSAEKEVEVKSDTMQKSDSGSAEKEVEEKSDTMQESDSGSAEKEVEGKSDTMQESNSGSAEKDKEEKSDTMQESNSGSVEGKSDTMQESNSES